ncbi:MAG: hypothetical protein J0H34_13315 [Rhizobiales bacterium]|nr:hypothetical protein [Hyphomicrobiales bacterium]
MKAALLAALIAATAVVPFAAPVHAASVTITTGDSDYVIRDRERDWRRHHHRRERMEDRWRHKRHVEECRIRTVKKWRNGERVIRRIRVCD